MSIRVTDSYLELGANLCFAICAHSAALAASFRPLLMGQFLRFLDSTVLMLSILRNPRSISDRLFRTYVSVSPMPSALLAKASAGSGRLYRAQQMQYAIERFPPM